MLMKKRLTRFSILCLSTFLLFACDINLVPVSPTTATATFQPSVDLGDIENPSLKEASGLAASRVNPGFFWSHNDSGEPNKLFCFDEKGKGLREFELEGAVNVDWEEMAIVGESGGSATIYVADFGDNDALRSDYTIYWCKEPVVTANVSNKITSVNSLKFTLPDGARDMECMLIDQKTKDIFIISKRENKKRLYKIPAVNVSNGARIQAEFVEELTFSIPIIDDVRVKSVNFISGGTVSADNSEILVKNYLEMYYWKRSSGETIPSALKRPPVKVTYAGINSDLTGQENQGEAVTFAANGSGYYTLGEGVNARLYFYKKK
jgi:hypothetical protein